MLPSVYLLAGSKPGLTPTLYTCLFLGSKQGGPRPLPSSWSSSSSSSTSPFPSSPVPQRPSTPAFVPVFVLLLSGSLLSRPLHGAQTSVHIHNVQAHGHKDSEREKLPLSLANTEIAKREWKREWKRDGGVLREEGNLARSFLPLSLSLPLSEAALSRFLRSSVPLSSRFIRCIGRAWGVTNPSRIRIAAPTVGIRRAIGPNDTRKPNGKRKYDPDFRSVKRIRETPDRAGLLLPVSPAHLRALYIHPLAENLGGRGRGGRDRASSLSLSIPREYSVSQPHLFTVTFECWKLDDWSRDRRATVSLDDPRFPSLRKGKWKTVSSVDSPATLRGGQQPREERGRRDWRDRYAIRIRFVWGRGEGRNGDRSSIAAI